MGDKKEVNYYKYSTFALIAVLVIAASIFLFTTYAQTKFNDGASYGQQAAISTILNTVTENGAVTIGNNGGNITLVPLQLAQQAQQNIQQQTIMTIMDSIEKEGYVSIYNNETEMILVQYQPPAQQQTMANSTTAN